MKISSWFCILPLIGMLGLFGGCSSDEGGGAPDKSKTVISASDQPRTVITAAKTGPSKPKGAPASTAGAKNTSETVTDDATLTGPIIVVSGRITFQDGKPATSASIELKGYVQNLTAGRPSFKQDTMTSGVTDDDGNYRLRGADSMQPTINIKGDFPETEATVDSKSNGFPTKPGTRHVKRDVVLAQPFTLTGRLVNEKDQPMPGLAVKIAPAKDYTRVTQINDTRPSKAAITTSTATGDFTFENIAAGDWFIGASSSDYAPITQNITIPTTDPVTLRFSARGATVQGMVIMKGEGTPVADVSVSLINPTGGRTNSVVEVPNMKTGSDGKFKFEHVTSTTVQAMAASIPDVGITLGMAKPNPGPFKVDEGETTDVVLFVYPGHTIMGTVFDKDTSDPLSGAKVSMSGSIKPSETTSDSDGKYRMDHAFGSNESSAQITVNLDGYTLDTANNYNSSQQMTLPEDYNEPVVKDLAMVRLITVSGKVVTKDEVPIPNATVKYFTSNNYTGSREPGKPVNSDGSFKLEAKPFTNGLVVAEATGYATAQSKSIEVTTENIEDVKVTMDVGGTIQGTVLDPSGQPVEGANVLNTVGYKFDSGSTINPNLQVDTTGEDGKFIMRDASTKAELTAGKTGFANSEKVTVEIQPGESRSGIILQLNQSESISGRVVKPGGEPVEGVDVSASSRNNSTGSGRSDKDGKFKVTGLAAGVYTLYANKSGTWKQVDGIKTGTSDAEIILGEEEGSGVLVGTVVDDITEKPIADFTVTGSNTRKLPQPGKFELSKMRKNMGYVLKLSAPGYLESSITVGPADISGRSEQTFKLGRGGAITGRVIEKATGKPVPNIVVVNWGTMQYYERDRSSPVGHSTTDEQGRFTLAPAPSGDNTLIVKSKEPFAEASKTVKVKSEETLDAGDIELSAGGTIKGTVVRGSGDEPVPGKDVQLYSYSSNNQVRKSTTTSPDGKFEFAGLAAGDYQISVSSTNKSQKLAADENVDVVFRIGGVKVTGTITRGGVPARSSLSANGADQVSFSSYAQNGNYTMEDVLPGKYDFNINSPTTGKLEVKETVTVPDEPEFVKDFVLPDGTLNVTVTDAAGQPVLGALVSSRLKNSATGEEQSWMTRAQTETTKSDGTVQFKGLAAGVYEISANKADVGSAMNGSVDVREGAPADVKLLLKGDGGTLVSVALSATDGKPVASAWCYLYGPDGLFGHGAQRDASGVMTIKNIPPGTYKTNVSYWSHSQSEKTVEIKAGETATIEDVLYAAGSVQWILKKADGTPAQGASVSIAPITTEVPEQPRSGRTDSTGNWEDRGLSGGTYQVTAQLPGKPSISELFEVKAASHTKKEKTVLEW